MTTQIAEHIVQTRLAQPALSSTSTDQTERARQNESDKIVAAFDNHLERALQARSDLDSRNVTAANVLLDNVNASQAERESVANDQDGNKSEQDNKDNQAQEEEDNDPADDPPRKTDKETTNTDDEEATTSDGASDSSGQDREDGEMSSAQTAAQVMVVDNSLNVDALIGESTSKDSTTILVATGMAKDPDTQVVTAQGDRKVSGQQTRTAIPGMGTVSGSDGDNTNVIKFNNMAQQLAATQTGQVVQQQTSAQTQSNKQDSAQVVLQNQNAAQSSGEITRKIGQTSESGKDFQHGQQSMAGKSGLSQADWLVQQQQKASQSGDSSATNGRSFIESLINGKQPNNPAVEAKSGAERTVQISAMDTGRPAAQPPQASINAEANVRTAPQNAAASSANPTSTNAAQANVASPNQLPPQPQSTQGTFAAQQSQNPQSSQQQKATEQVAMSIRKGVASGDEKIMIRLDPPELGRVDVKLTISAEGSVMAKIMANNQDTLDLLRRDSRELERALRDAGLDTSSDSMEFELSRDGASDFSDRAQNRGQDQRNSSTASDKDQDDILMGGDTEEATRHVYASDRLLDVIA